MRTSGLLGSASVDEIQEATENLFFKQAQTRLLSDLNCEQSNLEKLQRNTSPLVNDLQLKLPIIKALNKGAQERINRWQLLQGQIPHNPNVPLSAKYQSIKIEADRLNQEAKQMLEQSELITQSLPFGTYPEVQKLVSSLSEADLKNDSILKAKIDKAMLKAQQSFRKDIQGIGSAISPKGEPSRSFKERILQDSDLTSSLRQQLSLKEKEYDGFFCRMNAKYGEGTKIAETGLSIGSGLAGFGAFGYLAKLLRYGSVVKRSGTMMTIEKMGAGALAGGASLDLVNQIKKECVPVTKNQLKKNKDNGVCYMASFDRTLIEGNCALAVALPTLGFGSAALLSNTKLTAEFLAGLKGAKASTSKTVVARDADEPEFVYEWVDGKFIKKPLVSSGKNKDLKGESAGFLDEFTAPPPPKKPFVVPVPDRLVTQHHYQHYMGLLRQGKTAEAEAYERKVVNILSNEKIEDVARSVGTGIGEAKFIKFYDGTMGVWKPNNFSKIYVNGETHALSYLENGSAEVAAYKVDNFLGLHRVPPTVKRTFRGQKGTVQLMVGNLEQKFHVSNPHETRMFDYLIANNDRHLNNYLMTKEGYLVTIDNGLSLKSAPNEWSGKYYTANVKTVVQEYEAAVVESKKIWNSPTAQKKLADIRNETVQTLSALVGERRVYEKLQSTSEMEWRKLLREDLNNSQMTEFLKRRKEIIEVVEDARKKLGEDIFREGPASPAVRIFQEPK